MRSGLLHGREHTKIGAVAALAEGRCAIALSRGGYAKGYVHRDPNEDAAAFAFGAEGMLLAVADGHGGHEAAGVAVPPPPTRFRRGRAGPGPPRRTQPRVSRKPLARSGGALRASRDRLGSPLRHAGARARDRRPLRA